MSTFLDDLLKKMKTAPHVGVPTVTNPKLPTKVERDTADYAARQKAMPNFKFGNGHPSPIYADPKFNNQAAFIKKTVLSKSEQNAFIAQYEAYAEKLRAENAKREQETDKSITTNSKQQAEV